MRPVLRFIVPMLAICLIANWNQDSISAQTQSNLVSAQTELIRAANDVVVNADPSGEGLKLLGPQGQLIEDAREEVIAILTQTNSCSAWYRAAEPAVVAKFRSLRFQLDASGLADVLRLETSPNTADYYQPYVASTGQNVGWGSTIILNLNGAFFRENARVRVVQGLDEAGYFNSFKRLRVGDFAGASLAARKLTMLHELGHILNLLSIDAGVPHAPQISVQNTQTVLSHCRNEVRSHPKRVPSGSTPAYSASAKTQLTPSPQPVRRTRSTQ